MSMTIEHTTPSAGGPSSDAPPQANRAETSRSTASPRYAAKIARRELRRRPWRAALVVLLIAIPTWIMFNAAIDVRTTQAFNDSPGPDFASDLVASFTDPRPGDEVGDPSISLFGPSEMTSAQIEAALPAGSTVQRVIGGFTSIMTEDGEIESATFVKIDLATAAAAPWAAIATGRAPEFGEVVLGSTLADRLGVSVGDTVQLRQPAGEWRVSGISGSYDGRLFAVRDFDESLLTFTSGNLLIDLPQDIGSGEVSRLTDEIGASVPVSSRFAPDGSLGEDQYDDDSSEVGLLWLAAMLMFIMFGTIILAAFATIARGQLVTVGQLAANGAEQRFTRRVLALQGFWAGIVGVAVGGAATLATTPLIFPLIKASFYTPGSIKIAWSPLDLLVIGLTGIIVATCAASLPALALVKTSVLDALAGRRPEQPVPKWMVPVGATAFGLGLLLLTTSAASSSGAGMAGAMIGALIMVIGMCLIGPLVIQSVGRLASMMPLSIRISLRGLERARLRSSAVVSSIAVTTGVMAVIIAGLQTNVGGPQSSELADNVAVVSALPSLAIRGADGEALLDSYGAPLDDLPAEIDTVKISWATADSSSSAAAVRNVLPDATEHPIRVAVRPDGVYDNRDGTFVRKVDANGDERFGPMAGAPPGAMSGEIPPGVGPIEELESLPLVGDDSTLEMFSLPESFKKDLDTAGYAMAVRGSACGDDYSEQDYWNGEPIEAPADDAANPQHVDFVNIPVKGMPCWESVGPFMSERFAIDHGYQIEAAGSVFVNGSALTKAQRSQFDSAWEYPSAFVGWDYQGVDHYSQPPATESAVAARSYSTVSEGISVYVPSVNADDFALAQLILLGLAALFVTLIAAVGLGLAAADSRRDRAVLSVIGAKPATQRRIAAANAWVLVIIGTVLGVPAGLFAAHVVTVAVNQEPPTGIPWLFVMAEFVAVPLVVTALAYVAAWFRRSSSTMDTLQAD